MRQEAGFVRWTQSTLSNKGVIMNTSKYTIKRSLRVRLCQVILLLQIPFKLIFINYLQNEV